MSPEQLWALTDEEFNTWRRENDLKKLFAYFEQALPHFKEWLDQYHLTIEFVLDTNNPGGFFYGDNDTIVVESEDEGFKKYFFVHIYDREHDENLKKIAKSDAVKERRFTPYLTWAQQKTGDKTFIKTKFSDHDRFRIISRIAPDVPAGSQAIMAPGIILLKLGGVKIDGWGLTTYRNLDFTDLDFLEIEGPDHWNVESNIYFSSCRSLLFSAAEASFTNFYNCQFEKLNVNGSRLYSMRFFGCDIFGSNFGNTSITSLVLENCSVSGLSFSRVEIDGLVYLPPIKEWHRGISGTFEAVAENYKRLRVLYQNNGHRREAGEAYYNERLYELRHQTADLNPKWIFRIIKNSGYTYAKPHIKDQLAKVALVISGTVSKLIWGFGEKPQRTVIASLIMIFFFASVYFLSGIAPMKHDVVESVYLSVIMFSTLGFGDYTPVAGSALKLVLAIEALLGAFTYGLFIAGYANKSKY